ncbi:aspartic peptidase domain-containing protein [Gloeopeniophorella convolvens]|nr:aspartic peptidase domain-containing protein [Gloeopeniophorella convolvens]
MSLATQSLRFTSQVKLADGARTIIARDRARAQKLLAGVQPHGPNAHHLLELRARGRSDTEPLAGRDAAGDTIDVTDAAVTYTASVGVGSPATDYTLLIDTGSSNTWVGAGKKYKQTSTSKSTGKKVSVSYGSGSFSGTEFTDQVTLASELVIQSQSIGVASTAQGFDDVDGILGIGPVDLTEGTVGGQTPVPTVTDNLFKQGTISTESIGIFYQPSTSAESVANGELTFGGVDSTKTTGDVNFVPITGTSPASAYWGIDQDVTYGSSGESILSSTAGIVDTGTTLVLIATDAFQAYQKATGAKLDQSTGLLTLTASQFENLQSLFFNIGGVQYELTPNAQIWPRALNSQLGGTEGDIYLVVSDLGSPSGQGLDFINGFTFLQRFYSVFDVTNSQVGLATTAFTDAETN